MRNLMPVLWMFVLATPALAGPHGHERREERREERHEERREEQREVRHEERREERHDMGPRMGPPAARFERHEMRHGYVWINGRYDWDGGRYVWVPGRYEHERVGFRWREPRWEVRDGVYVRVDGGWDPLGPTAAPPPIRVERWAARPGFVWIRGHWDWRGQWVWTPGHYERPRAGYVWREPHWEPQGGVYVQVGGTWQAGQ